MGMLMLLAGLLLWSSAHLFKRLNPTKPGIKNKKSREINENKMIA